MLETLALIFGIIVGAFVLIFGGRGLVDLYEARRRRKENLAQPPATTTPASRSESTIPVQETKPIGPLTEATIIGLYPLLGREKELSFLRERVDAALRGSGSVVFITGQAGIGKTRLAREAQNYARQSGCQWLEGKYEKGVSEPYKAWTDVVQNYRDQNEARPLQSLVGPYAVHLAKIVPGMREALGIPSGAEQGDPQGERRRLFEGLTKFFVQISNEKPLVLFLDDLQWAVSIEFLHYFSRNIGNQQVFTLAAYRDDDLKENPNLWDTVLAMNRERLFHPLPLKVLDKEETGQLISSMVEGSAAPRLLDAVYERTQANPFFVEEVVRFLREREAIVQTEAGWDLREPTSLETPESVKAVIAERLAQLGQDAGETLRMAAVIGREFSLRLLRELMEQSEEALIEIMDRCEKAGLVARKRSPGEEVYSFTNDLVREALYESIGSARRSRQHLRIGEALEKLYPSALNQRCDALAHHFFEGNELEKTATYSWRAGKKASAQFAYGTAVAYFEQALSALEHLPESRETLEQAIAIQVDLGPTLHATKGPGAPEVEETYTKAKELCQRVGETPKLFPVLWGLSRVYNFRGDLQLARSLGEELLAMAQRMQDPALILEAHHTLWAILFSLGELAAAQKHAEQGIASYNQQQHSHLAFLYGGHDPGVCCRTHAARQLWLLGYPEQALQRCREALGLARELSQQYSLATALLWGGWVHQQCGETQVAREWSGEAFAIGTEHGFPRFRVQGTLLEGWLLVEQGQVEEGIVQMRQVFAGHFPRAVGRDRTYFLALMAEAYGRRGEISEGLSMLTEELVRASKTGERFYESELHRIKGELLLRQGDQYLIEAEGCFQKALEVARSQGAKSLELRAAMSLNHLWQRQSKKEEARQLLGDIYGWFTEGFDTADLKEAKAMLKGLS